MTCIVFDVWFRGRRRTSLGSTIRQAIYNSRQVYEKCCNTICTTEVICLLLMRIIIKQNLFFFSTSSKRFTRHKTALITIKDFRLVFTRVPIGTPGKVSSEPSLAIECSSFSILGSSGEAVFGNPKPITDHPDLYEWSECLKRDGGAGCVLVQWDLLCVC